MRLAYLCADPGIALGSTKGAAVHVIEVAEALAAQGAELLLLVTSVEGYGQVPLPGIEVEVLPGMAKRMSIAERIQGQAALSRWIERRMRSFAADGLYERIALCSTAGSSAAKAAGVPHLVELNAPLPEEAARYRRLENRPLAERLDRAVLEQADLVLAVSRPLAAYAAVRGAARVEMLPNAVAAEHFAGLVDDRASDPLAVFAGSLRPWHGIETLTAAWRLLGESAPRLRVLGDGPRRDELVHAGAELVGAVAHEQMPAALAQADIGLVPYGSDSPDYFSPLKLFEYMAAGLAIVAAEIPGVVDVVGPDEAILVPRGDPQRLAEAVSELAAAPQLRRRLGRAARALAAAEHTWDRRAQRILDAARQLTATAMVKA